VSRYFPEAGDYALHTIFPGVRIRTCACEHIMTSLAELDANAVVAEHSHPHEQVGLVLEGRAIFWIGGEEKTLGPGDQFRIPGSTPHRVVVLDKPTRVLDIFHPVRNEYR
jgi:quercetin dioxygenase-like cupin family protein